MHIALRTIQQFDQPNKAGEEKMKKIVITGLWLTFVMVAPMVALSQNAGKESFYQGCIEKKIERCGLKATRLDSRSERIKREAESARRKAEFYKANREELTRQMTAKDVREKFNQVDYFLIKAYDENVKQARTELPN
jgi:hypothetical protein